MVICPRMTSPWELVGQHPILGSYPETLSNFLVYSLCVVGSSLLSASCHRQLPGQVVWLPQIWSSVWGWHLIGQPPIMDSHQDMLSSLPVYGQYVAGSISHGASHHWQLPRQVVWLPSVKS